VALGNLTIRQSLQAQIIRQTPKDREFAAQPNKEEFLLSMQRLFLIIAITRQQRRCVQKLKVIGSIQSRLNSRISVWISDRTVGHFNPAMEMPI
jgi:hypothetical protein